MNRHLRSAAGAAFLIRSGLVAGAIIATDTARRELVGARNKVVLWFAERMDPAGMDFCDCDLYPGDCCDPAPDDVSALDELVDGFGCDDGCVFCAYDGEGA